MKMAKCMLAATVAVLVGSAFAAEKLAEGFAPLAWIESTGEQYIDTGVDAGAKTTVDLSFGHCLYSQGATFFGKDVWDPKGFLFILQNEHFRFFGNTGREPGPMWNLIDMDPTEERDYRFVLGTDSKARLFDATGKELCALATDRSSSSHHPLWLFKCNSQHSTGGEFRLYAMKIGQDSGEVLRDFVPARRLGDRAVGLYDRVTRKFFANAGGGAFRAPDDPVAAGPRRWSIARAQAWGKSNPWFCGFNHVPANAINDTEIWQEETFSPDVIKDEFKLATGLGFNCVRIFIQYKVYEHDPVWFHKAFEKYLQLADEAKLKVMPTLFDDCSFGLATEPTLGKQTDPLIGWNMWGWTPSPGYTMVVDHRTHGKLEKYVKDLISTHKDDPRIFAWDLYNEPVNGMGGYSKYSLALVKKCFVWARSVNPSQPLTVGRWNGNAQLNRLVARESDIISYHCYSNAQRTRAMIDELSKLERPMVCTEWFLRCGDCDIEHCLGIYKERGVGCMMWGLVNGKTQTHLPFGYCADKPPYTGRWKHDLFHADHTPYNPKELELLRELTGANVPVQENGNRVKP